MMKDHMKLMEEKYYLCDINGEKELSEDYIKVIAKANGTHLVCSAIHKNNVSQFLATDMVDAKDDDIESIEFKVPSWRYTYVLVYNIKAEKVCRFNMCAKPTIMIQDAGIEIYSNCIICRKNECGELESLTCVDYTPIIMSITDED